MPTPRFQILFAALLAGWIASGSPQATASEAVADVDVQTASGRSAHFYRDLVQGRLVAINFIYTSCSSVCPLLGARFAQTQKLLGTDAAQIAFISISIDPVDDTPQRLAAWSERFGPAPNWTLVTGTKPDIDALVKSLGTTTADRDTHAPLLLLVDDRGDGARRRLDGLIEPAKLADLLRAELHGGPGAAAAAP